MDCFSYTLKPLDTKFTIREPVNMSLKSTSARAYRLRPMLIALIASLPTIASGADPTGVELLRRLEKLEERLGRVELENTRLREQLKLRSKRQSSEETRVAKAALPGVVPTYTNVNGDSLFKIRGVIDADSIAFHEREGGYDFNSGTGLRRARIGLEGDAFMGQFKWRLESDFAGNVVGLTDAYVQFVPVKPWTFTLGQHKAFLGLESNNSDNFNTFLERGMFNNAAGTAGAERRIGLSAFYGTDTLTAGFGVFGDNESASRVATAPDESIGLSGRTTWAPIFEPGHILQLGLSGYYRDDLKEGGFADAIRLSDRPNARVDGGTLADTGVIRQVESLSYLGLESTYIQGPLTLAGEYGRVVAARKAGLADLVFDGYYVYGTWFLTGESRNLKVGSFNRLKPWRDFDWEKGTWGAFELAFRFDSFDFSETPVAINRGNQGKSVTAALNWYLNGNLKVMLNWVHFQGDRTPLDRIGNQTKGDAIAARLHLDW